MIDRARAEIVITDVLAGEGSVQDLDELYRSETDNLGFKEYREGLKTIWGSDSTDSFHINSVSDVFRAKTGRIVADIISVCGEGAKLSLDSLDPLSVARTDMLNNDYYIEG